MGAWVNKVKIEVWDESCDWDLKLLEKFEFENNWVHDSKWSLTQFDWLTQSFGTQISAGRAATLAVAAEHRGDRFGSPKLPILSTFVRGSKWCRRCLNCVCCAFDVCIWHIWYWYDLIWRHRRCRVFFVSKVQITVWNLLKNETSRTVVLVEDLRMATWIVLKLNAWRGGYGTNSRSIKSSKSIESECSWWNEIRQLRRQWKRFHMTWWSPCGRSWAAQVLSDAIFTWDISMHFSYFTFNAMVLFFALCFLRVPCQHIYIDIEDSIKCDYIRMCTSMFSRFSESVSDDFSKKTHHKASPCFFTAGLFVRSGAAAASGHTPW